MTPMWGAWGRRGLDALFVLMLVLYVAGGRDAVPFHGDESTFLWMSRDADTLLLLRDPEPIALSDSPSEPLAQQLRVLNGSLAPLAIGVTRRAAGFARSDLNDPWVWTVPGRPASEQWEWNVSANRLPDPALLSWARLPSALATAASVALVFGIALGSTGTRLAGWVAAGFYATTPALLLDGRRAMQEGILLFATALLVGIGLAMLRERARDGTGQPPTGWLLALAAATGFALAAKHSAALVAVPVWLAVACVPWLRDAHPERDTVRRHLASLLGAGLAGLALFTLLSPVWWSLPRTLELAALAALAWSFGAPLRARTRLTLRAAALGAVALGFLAQPSWLAESAAQAQQLVAARRALLQEQTARFGQPPLWRPATLVRQATVAAPRFFDDPAWAEFPEIQRQIEGYVSSPWAGRAGATRWPVGLLLAVLAAVGGVSAARRWRDPRCFLLAAWLALPGFVLLANPLPWPRYYLLLHAPLAVLAGHGAARVAAGRGGAT